MRNLPITPSTDEIQPWHSLGGIEFVCELRKSCTVLYGIFTELARLVYHSADGRLVGTPDVLWRPTTQDIWIDTELRWEDQHPEVRPAIYVQLGPIKYDEIKHGHNGRIEAANRFAERHYEMKAAGEVTFMHVASTVGEACSLADNTDYMLSLMQEPIKRDFCFTKFVQAGRTPLEKLPDESTERYASGVTFSYEFEEAWDVAQESPILKSIDIIHASRRDPSFIGEEKPAQKTEYLSDCSRHDTVDRVNILTENKISG